MNRFLPRVSILAAVLAIASLATAAVERPLFVPGEVLVKFRPGLAPAHGEALLRAEGLQEIRRLRADGILHLRMLRGGDPRDVATRLRGRPEVAAAEPNYFRYLDGAPNDPRFTEMYGLDNTGQTGGTPDADIDAPEAWDLATGSPDVVVAVLDSGIDMNHEDLLANLYTNPGEVLNGVDDDGNGYVDDVRGWDFRDNDNNPSDPSTLCASHGTHTSGTVGAVGNNGIGVTGVAQTVRIMPLRAFYVSLIFCTAQDSDLLEAIDYMRRMNVPISNNSWGGGPFSQLMFDTIAASRHLFVTSAGNSGSNNDTAPAYPASYSLDQIVAVAATDHRDARASFSNFGATSVDLAAPGVAILSTTRGDTYGTLDGTSMASPHVAGAAAVLLGDDPTLTPNELKYRLLRGVDALGLPVLSRGRLNLFGSLTLPALEVTIDVVLLSPPVAGPGDTVDYSVEVENSAPDARTVTASVRAWTPGGTEVYLQAPRTLNLAAGQILSGTFSAVVPAGAPLGEYRIIGQVESLPEIFDEDQEIARVE